MLSAGKNVLELMKNVQIKTRNGATPNWPKPVKQATRNYPRRCVSQAIEMNSNAKTIVSRIKELRDTRVDHLNHLNDRIDRATVRLMNYDECSFSIRILPKNSYGP